MTWLSEHGGEYVASARQAIRTNAGNDSLRGLGWWDLLDDLDHADVRTAAFALFEAQGREGGDTGALNAVVALPYVAIAGGSAASYTMAMDLDRSSSSATAVLLGDVTAENLLVDRPGTGVHVVAMRDVRCRALDVQGGSVMRTVEYTNDALTLFLDEHSASIARARSVFLGRVAVAHELLGAALAALELAVEHATQREQFGRPIGTFQAVRYLLSWAAIECSAIRSVCDEAIRLDTAAPPSFGAFVKAIAGRNARRACEGTLQVLGGIGFTAEYPHHRFHGRVLALDPLLGGSDELTYEIGRAARHGHAMSDLSRALLQA